VSALRTVWWGCVVVAVASVLSTLGAAEYARYVVEHVQSADLTRLRDEDTTADDPASVASITTITAMTVGRKQWCYCVLKGSAAGMTVDVTPIFRNASGTVQAVGDEVTLTTGWNSDANAYYLTPPDGGWETYGHHDVIFAVRNITGGTLHEVWGGTR